MIIKLDGNLQVGQPGVLEGVRCPACRQLGTFQPLQAQDSILGAGSVETIWFGQRMCPNTSCRALLFVVLKNGRPLVTYPAERIDFDDSAVPPKIKEALEEAITCHASGCYVASAIMVRKTLEVLCEDRGASGADLKKRLQALAAKIVVPTDLLEGLDHLRLMGNDAAHVESKSYDGIGPEETTLAIDFTKELLKATFQYASLVDRFKKLQKPPSSAAPPTP